MKTGIVKTYILTIAQLPVVVAQLIVSIVMLVLTCMDWLLTKCRCKMDGLIYFENNSSQNNTKGKDESLNLTGLLDWVNNHNDAFVEHFRERLEATGVGPDAVKQHPNRQLYAVLKPTKEENIERIKNVLLAMDIDVLQETLADVQEIQHE